MTPIRVAPWTLGLVVMLVTICMSPMSLDQAFLQAAGYATPLWLAMAGVTGLLGVWLTAGLMEADLAPWAAWLRDALRFPRALFYTLGAGLMLNAWLKVVIVVALGRTPRPVLALALVLIAVYVLRLGMESTIRFVGFLALLIVPAAVVLEALGLLNADVHRALPLDVATVPWLWPAILFAPRGYTVLPVLAPHAGHPWRKAAYLGVALGFLLTFAPILLPVLVFGYPAAAADSAPLFHAIGAFSSTFLPFQRIEFISLISWQMTSGAMTAVYALCALSSLKVRLAPLTPWPAVLGAALATLALALPVWPPQQYAEIMNDWSIYGLLLFFALPAALLSLGRQRGREVVPA